MTPPLTAARLMPFVPAEDFEASQRFYAELGFEAGYTDDSLQVLSLGGASFYLQRFYDKDLAENLMIQLFVPDLDAWWRHIEALELPARYPKARVKPPVEKPWGQRVIDLIDPSGVLWTFVEAG